MYDYILSLPRRIVNPVGSFEIGFRKSMSESLDGFAFALFEKQIIDELPTGSITLFCLTVF